MSPRLGVEHHEQAALAGVLDDGVQGRHALGAELLEEGRLGFDDRHERGDDVDHLAGEAAEGFGAGAGGFAEFCGKEVPARVDADHRGGAAIGDGLGEALAERLLFFTVKFIHGALKRPLVGWGKAGFVVPAAVGIGFR